MTAHGLGLPAYDPDVIDGSVLPVDVVLAACDDLLGRSHDGACRAAASCTPAASTSSAPARWSGRTSSVGCATRSPPPGGQLTEVVTSEHDILDGIAWSIATR